MNSKTAPKVVGAGLIALDWVIGADADDPVGYWAGGTCGNVLSILAYLGWDAYPIARMNGDSASERVRNDMASWGVHLDWTNCAPTTDTPIVVQQIRRQSDGRTRHRFSWSCPHCGKWLPPFRAITIEAGNRVKPVLENASVFFLDRLSRAVLTLAAEASADGAVVVFEPSSKGPAKLLPEAIRLAHVVKYAEDRLSDVPGVMGPGSATLLEVQTLAERGLRYRHRLNGAVSEWLFLESLPPPQLTDTCGSGDWCTAGLIATSITRGQKGFWKAGAIGIEKALRYGQALAAWNCSFEGARGGMYAVPKSDFETQVKSLVSGETIEFAGAPLRGELAELVPCPGCVHMGASEGVD